VTHGPANPHGAHLTIDLDAIVHNWRLLAAQGEAKGAECGGVVKANAYGTGIEQTGAALYRAGCRTFFVAHVTEGERLRRVAPEAVIYVLNGLPSGGASAYEPSRLRPVLGSIEEIGEWGDHVTQAGHPGEAAIHVDTGLNRLGLDPEVWRELAGRIGNGDYGFMPTLLITHLASSETLDTQQNAEQARLFAEMAELAPDIAPSFCNSSAVFRDDLPKYSLTRPGYALYGGKPTPWTRNPMREVVRLQAPILQIRSIEAGERVGYNARWQAKRPTVLVTISIGYADGFPRLPPNPDTPVGEVLIGETLCPIVGRLSMDLMIIDATDAHPEHVQRGAMVTVIGGVLDIDRVGQMAGTIGYLMLTSLSPRYTRTYLGG
jgi:alanine racemase